MIQARTFPVELSMDIGQHSWTSSLFTMMCRYYKSTSLLLTEFVIEKQHASVLYHIAPPSSTQLHPTPCTHYDTKPHHIVSLHTTQHRTTQLHPAPYASITTPSHTTSYHCIPHSIAPHNSTQHHTHTSRHQATPHRITTYHTASHHASLAPLHDTRITTKITIVCSRQCMFNVYVCNAHSILMFTRLWQHFI